MLNKQLKQTTIALPPGQQARNSTLRGFLKKFLLALKFGSLNITQTGLPKVGCYNYLCGISVPSVIILKYCYYLLLHVPFIGQFIFGTLFPCFMLGASC
jgi:hypothetical protein